MGTSVVRGLWCRTEILFTGCHARGKKWQPRVHFEMYLYVKRFMPSVPLCQMYLYAKCTFMSNVPLCQMYLYIICTFMSNVPLCETFLCEVYLYGKCTFMANVFMSNVPLCEVILCQMFYVKWIYVKWYYVKYYWSYGDPFSILFEHLFLKKNKKP